jgi:hypothetical protein
MGLGLMMDDGADWDDRPLRDLGIERRAASAYIAKRCARDRYGSLGSSRVQIPPSPLIRARFRRTGGTLAPDVRKAAVGAGNYASRGLSRALHGGLRPPTLLSLITETIDAGTSAPDPSIK